VDQLVPLKLARIDAGELLTELATRFSSLAERSGVRIAVEATEGIALIVDRVLLVRALSNLLDNALAHHARTIHLHAEQRPGQIELGVHDDGDGFPEEFLDSAFERFARADQARTTGGAGLGLAIVQAIAEAHGGQVRARNAEDGGAVVVVTIPWRNPTEAAAQPRADMHTKQVDHASLDSSTNTDAGGFESHNSLL
jgi:signal transduction histidine kinase